MSASAVSIEVTVTHSGLIALEREWDALWRDAGATPFQSPAWLVPWWHTFGFGQLCGIACRDGRDLVAFAPLFIVQRAAKAPRHVQLLGTGNTDYLDAIVQRGYERELAAAVAGVLTHRTDWDVCDLRNLRPSSALLALTFPVDWSGEQVSEPPCPVIDITTPLPAAIMDDIAYGQRRAMREGGLTIRLATAGTVADDLTLLFALHGARWRQRGEAGVLRDAATQQFHRVTSARLVRDSMLQLITTWIGTCPVAAYYGVVHADRAYYYLSGFDPAYSALNVGKLVVGAAVEHARGREAKWFDFLGGSESYKYEWGAIDEPRHRLVIRRCAS
jgi:CelD/BcsL family acetyltransferase involved in cellulose biosynthesis